MRKATVCHYPELDNGLSKNELQTQVTDLKHRVSTFEQFLKLLVTMPTEHGFAVLEKVRAGMEIDSLLNSFAEADLLLQLSVVPETGRRRDFPYSKQMPEHLLFEGNHYLSSSQYEAAPLPSLSSLSPGKVGTGKSHQQCPIVFPRDVYEKPFWTATVFDPMLEKIDVCKWTTVTLDNRLLRKYLANYFHAPIAGTQLFQKDLLFEDMIAGETRYASRLLVNAVLAVGCVSQPVQARS